MDSSDNYFNDDQDLKFHVQHYPWDEVLSLMPQWEKEDSSTIIQDATAILETVGSLIAREFAPLAPELSEQHPSLRDGGAERTPLMNTMVNQLAELGAMGTIVSPEFGGMGMPVMMGHAITQLLARCEISLSNVYAYYLGGAKILETFHGIQDFGSIIPQVAAGQAYGAMALTEPQAGSDLSQIKTKAIKQSDGTWILRGQKIWITCGDAAHHFVLARSKSEKEAPGLAGLSLFYAPAFLPDGSRNIEVSGLEKKIGHHPIVTASINYNDSKAHILGEEGEGLNLMLHLMNHARVSTASMALGALEHVLRVAQNYAKQRITMGQPIAEHPMIAEMLEDMDATSKGIRALVFECLYHEDMEFHLRVQIKSAKNDQEKTELNKKLKHHYWKARSLTPLVKYFATEECVRLSRNAIQILGGSGFMKEYGLGRFHTDSLLFPIYEGTSQIQSLMVLKDRLKKTFQNPKSLVQQIARNRYDLLKELDPLQRKVIKMRQIYLQFIQSFIMDAVSDKMKALTKASLKNLSTEWKKGWDPKKGMNYAMKHAERFTKVVAYMSTGEILMKRIEQAQSEEEKKQRREIAERFVKYYELRCRHALEELKNDSSSSWTVPVKKTKTKMEIELAS